MTRTEWFAVGVAASYLVLLGVAMQYTAYDTWGALIVAPVIVIISGPLINRAFRGNLSHLRRLAWMGLAAKLAGGIAGYSVRVAAYGTGDAVRYDQAGKRIAGDVWSGDLGLLEAIPTSEGTAFLEEFTGFVYVFTGSSRLAGFLVFSWFSYVGLLMLVRAAAIAVPRLDTRLYAIVVFFFPSLIYWGSSIGKEAVLGLFMGIGAYGAALLLRQRRRNLRSAIYLVIGVGGSLLVRPHFAALLIGGVTIALVTRVGGDMLRRSRSPESKGGVLVLGTFVLAVFAVAAFAGVANYALDTFAPVTSDAEASVGDRFSQVFNETSRRTAEGGSSFRPPTVNGPTDFPYAAARTLTRPLIIEARSIAELLPAVEMGALFAVGLINWRRLAHVPKMMFNTPYVMFAVATLFAFGVAFSSIGNTGILVRQRSLILPFLLLFWCLPPLPERVYNAPSWRDRARITTDRSPVGVGR